MAIVHLDQSELKRDVPNMARKTKMTPDQNGRYYGYTMDGSLQT
jgi:hypothetical protein